MLLVDIQRGKILLAKCKPHPESNGEVFSLKQKKFDIQTEIKTAIRGGCVFPSRSLPE